MADDQQIQNLTSEVRRIDRSINSTDAQHPGIALRMDRLERKIAAVEKLITGGLVGMAGTLVLLWKIGQLLSKAIDAG